jgi:hypothetical protein
MTREKINEMVDRKIIESLNTNAEISKIQTDLTIRMTNFKKSIDRLGGDFNELYTKDFDDIDKVRERYGITYIKQCEKRISDLNWMLNKSVNFKKFDYKKMFELVRFRDKLNKK